MAKNEEATPQAADPGNAVIYKQSSWKADKLLEPDGSVKTRTGVTVSGPDAGNATLYARASWTVDKLLAPDGSVNTGMGGSGAPSTPGGTTGQIQYNSSGALAGATIATDGNRLGFNSTPSPSCTLDLGGVNATNFTIKTGTLLIQPFQTGNSLITDNSYFTSGNYMRVGAGYASGVQLYQGQVMLFGAPNGTAGTATGQITVFKSDFSNNGSVALGGTIGFNPGAYAGASMVVIGTATTAVNWLQVIGAVAGSGPIISAQGTDTNINVTMTPKGTGAVSLTGVRVFANNAAAIAGGLTAGCVYRTGADPDVLCIVH